ncbi:MAG: cyclic nucleotide-binding domain-containing protein [Methylococcales bacterium]|jgi:signal transduction histidine kinase|nr:cyclic nucleotide-binding domain-containing protein [Methylococcales bacterium]MBT7408769.1 cyclic nucleotide-binding domain-containing protein [Methylococcales bacterium]
MEEITLVQIDAKETTFNDRNLMKELSQKIKETEMFKDFTDDEIHILTNYARAYQVNKGMPILREGEVDCYMCLVTEGEIDIFRECGNNCRLKICVVGKGQTIGEMSMVDGLPNSATAIASIDTSIVLFSKRHFVTLTSEHPEIASMIMWKLSELLSLRLRKTSSLLVDSATTSKGLREARDEALKKAKDKSAFFAGMSHELRTPLNAMIGYGELLKEINEENNTEVETAGDNVKAVDSMLKASKHLLEMINDVLDFSKAEAGKLQIYVEPFDVSTFIDEIQDVTKTLIHENNNQLNVEISPDIGDITLDKSKLRQILFNLISNASKFTNHGTITIKVSSTKIESENNIYFMISDTGIGIDKNHLSQLFNPYVQANASISSQYGGTGLGLAICQELSQVMGGKIDVESQLHKGTTFHLYFPLSQ